MSFTRPLSTLRVSRLLPLRMPITSQIQIRFATQDYGSGDGNPVGEKPQQQGQNQSENVEHPGPPPPEVAKGKSSSSPNKDSKEHQTGSQTQTDKSSSSGQKRSFSTFTRRMAEKKEPAVSSAQQNKPSKEAMENAKPKILNENPPAGEEQSGDVKKHNEEMANRAEQAHEKAGNEDAPGDKEKVPKEFWKGDGGRGENEGVRG